MASERITEQLVRKRLDFLGYGSPDNDIAVEEQKSQIDAVKRLLKNASKTGKGGKGVLLRMYPREQVPLQLWTASKSNLERH